MSNDHKVTIIGGGFGGLRAEQARVDVTLIDRRNFHLFQPLLYQVATGSLAPGEALTSVGDGAPYTGETSVTEERR